MENVCCVSHCSSARLFFLKVDLCIEPGQSLGLMIRGGVEYNLGIFITGVDKDSVADTAGLTVSTLLTIKHFRISNEECSFKNLHFPLGINKDGKTHMCAAFEPNFLQFIQ